VEEATLDAFFMPELAIFLKPEKRPPDFAGATFADRLITFTLVCGWSRAGENYTDL
jgi:hypothetical protein